MGKLERYEAERVEIIGLSEEFAELDVWNFKGGAKGELHGGIRRENDFGVVGG